MLNNNFLKKRLSVIARGWRAYENYAETVTGFQRDSRLRDVSYWRKKLFSVFAVYFVPVSLIALIPGVWMSVKTQMWSIACIDIASAVFISLILFSKKVSLGIKKISIAGILYLLALMLIATLGLFGPGMLYLFGVTVFMSVMFSRKYAYWSVAAHAVTCVAFGILVNSGTLIIVHEIYALGTWIAFSSNLIFLSLVSVMLIGTIISGLERTVIAENSLNVRLACETQTKDTLNSQLRESESQYKALFFENPKPMYVMDPFTLKILQVNDAAIHAYGYTQEEFSRLALRDIRYDPMDAGVVQVAEEILRAGAPYNIMTRHRTKSGRVVPMDVTYNVISYSGKQAVLGMANDLTHQLARESAIEQHNKKLTEICFIQSHLVRAPLACIMGLVQLIKEANDNPAIDQEVNFLSESATELDQIITQVIQGIVASGEQAGSH